MTYRWQVKNRETGIVVSEWRSQFDALQDKQRRDDEWWEVQPAEESKLVVEGTEANTESRPVDG